MPKGQFSHVLKEKLNTVIDETARIASLFVRDPERDFTRDRKLPVGETLRLMCGMKGNTLNKELYDAFKDRDKTVSASAFVQRRDKILPDMLEYIFHEFNALCNDTKTYRGYNLYAVDGSDLHIPTDEIADTYMPNGDNAGYNMLHLNVLYDLCNRTYRDVIVEPRPSYNERIAAIRMAKRCALGDKDILIADRGYGSYNFFEHLNRIGTKYIVRVKNNDWTELRKLPDEEFDKDMSIELRTGQTNADKAAYAIGTAKFIIGPSKFGKPKKDVSWDFESPFVFKYRVVRIEIAPDSYETIITNLNRFEFPASEIKKLYGMRWGIETSFRELKYSLGLINFHARKKDSVIQEVYAKLVMYNFCERIASGVTITQNKNNKHVYQINYTMAITICIDFFRCHETTGPPPEKLIRKYILPIRPGRSDQRKMRTKSAVFFIYRVA